MADTVNIPLIGTVSKKTAVFTGIGIGALGLIYVIRRRKAAGSSPAAGTVATGIGQQTDPAGNTGTINPETGYVYGSAEDQQALAALQNAGTPYDTSALGTGLSGYYYGSGSSTQTSAPGPGNFADNAEWAQYAENYMITTLSADPEATGNALGKYITGQPVTSAQRDIIEEAIAIAGQPPQSGANGYPPNINLSGSTTQNVTVPDETGKQAGKAHNDLVAAGLVPVADPGQKPSDTVSSTTPKAGTSVAKGTHVLITAQATAQMITVPQEAGKTAGQAHNDLVRAGLVPTAPASQKPSQKVRSTTPGAGSKVTRGSKIQINT